MDRIGPTPNPSPFIVNGEGKSPARIKALAQIIFHSTPPLHFSNGEGLGVGPLFLKG